MVRKDYLLKQIDEFGKVLSKLLALFWGLKEQGEISNSLAEISTTMETELGFGIDEILAIPASSFLGTWQEKEFSNANVEQIANMLLIIADGLYAERGLTEESKKFYRKCLEIYEYLNTYNTTYSYSTHLKIEKITKILQGV